MKLVLCRESFGKGVEGATYQDIVSLEDLLQCRRHGDIRYRIGQNQFRKCVYLFKKSGINFRETIVVAVCEGVFDGKGDIPWLA